ncbi:DMT family transporter [Kitasatospora sp. NPDC059648]|uniref:DMT family transporter n=1 Tax=Kitasatospora sp. NPDC059648 TaxID=3346894 RepID=UPI0036B95411
MGLAGVALAVLGTGGALDRAGLAASVGAMLVSSVGYVLAARWREGADPLAATAWQLTAGALVLVPLAAGVEGAPPPLNGPTLLAFGYVTLAATALAFACWFTGLRHLPAGTVGLLGLLNPLTGVLLGTTLDGDELGPRQGLGLALVAAGILLGAPRSPTRTGADAPTGAPAEGTGTGGGLPGRRVP